MKRLNTKNISRIGALSAAAFILQLLGSVIGLKVGGFLEIEISDLPALIGTFAMGPAAGVMIELVKNILHCAITSTGFVGEFAAGCGGGVENLGGKGSVGCVEGGTGKWGNTTRGAALGMTAAVFAMTAAGVVTNLYIMLPLYMPTADFGTKLSLVLSMITPFNLCKGAALSLITFLSYKKLKPIIMR